MQEKRPKVSVVMPLYNAEAYIEQAICSVKAQSMEDWELIVIDDGSSDASLEIAQAFAAEDSRIQVLRNKQNMGVSRTRNRGIALSRGEYIALLDSDDVWYPEKLRCQLARMAEEKADFCYSSYAIIGADGRKVKGTIHWVSAPNAVDTTVMLYDNMFTIENVADMPEGKTYEDYFNPDSAIEIAGAKAEPSLADAKPGEKFQFVRLGYFTVDSKYPHRFNRIVELKGSFKA